MAPLIAQGKRVLLIEKGARIDPKQLTGAEIESASLHYAQGGAHPTVMRPQAFPAVTAQDEIMPISISSPAPGVFIFDIETLIFVNTALQLRLL